MTKNEFQIADLWDVVLVRDKCDQMDDVSAAGCRMIGISALMHVAVFRLVLLSLVLQSLVHPSFNMCRLVPPSCIPGRPG